MSLWLIGAGPHACAYAKVLSHLNIEYEVIGRSASSANDFTLATGKTVHAGGLANALLHSAPPKEAIVAASFDQLAGVAIDLIKAGTRRILLEKPGGLSKQEITQINDAAKLYQSDVWIGYNRRFYASTALSMQKIAEDGGAGQALRLRPGRFVALGLFAQDAGKAFDSAQLRLAGEWWIADGEGDPTPRHEDTKQDKGDPKTFRNVTLTPDVVNATTLPFR